LGEGEEDRVGGREGGRVGLPCTVRVRRVGGGLGRERARGWEREREKSSGFRAM